MRMAPSIKDNPFKTVCENWRQFNAMAGQGSVPMLRYFVFLQTGFAEVPVATFQHRAQADEYQERYCPRTGVVLDTWQALNVAAFGEEGWVTRTRSSAAERGTHNPEDAGSNPAESNA